MLIRMFSLPVQFGLGWIGCAIVLQEFSVAGFESRFLFGLVAGFLVWTAGVLCRELMSIDDPGSVPRLMNTLFFSVLAGVIAHWLPQVFPNAADPIGQLPSFLLPLLGAMVGYQFSFRMRPA